MTLLELLPYILTFYISCAVSYALYAVNLSNTLELIANTSKSSKSRKLLTDLDKKARLYLKLSPIWPAILCLIIVKKIRG